MPILGLWGMSSVYYIDDAGYQSIFDEKKNMAQYRAQNGKLYQYKFSQWHEWNYPVSNVASATATGINEWWRTGSGMMIMPDVSSLAPIGSVIRVNSVFGFGVAVTGLVFDSSNQFFWVCETSSFAVRAFTQSLTITNCFSLSTSIDSSSISPQDLAYDTSNDRLWVADLSTDKIYQITKSATLISCFSIIISIDSSATTTVGLAYDTSNDRLWVADASTDKIYQITKSATLISNFTINSVTNVNSTGFIQGGISYNSKTDKLVLFDAGNNYIYELTKSGTVAQSALNMTNIDSSNTGGGRGITYNKFTERYFSMNAGNFRIYEIPNYYAAKFTSDKAPFNKYPTPHFAQRFDGTIQLAEDNP